MTKNNNVIRITPGRTGKYDPETIQKGLMILQKGGTLREAAQATGMTVQALQYHKKKYNVRGPRDHAQPYQQTSTSPNTTQTVDPLAQSEERLFSQFDEEISRHEEVLRKVLARLRTTIERRNNLASALGRPKREMKVNL